MLEIYTVQLAQWRKVKALGIELVDITAKSGNHLFAPDYSHVIQYKNNELTENQYTVLYRDKMRWSYTHHRDEWNKLSGGSKIALACYCKAGEFCHRHLFKDMLIKHCVKNNIEYQDLGEIT